MTIINKLYADIASEQNWSSTGIRNTIIELSEIMTSIGYNSGYRPVYKYQRLLLQLELRRPKNISWDSWEKIQKQKALGGGGWYRNYRKSVYKKILEILTIKDICDLLEQYYESPKVFRHRKDGWVRIEYYQEPPSSIGSDRLRKQLYSIGLTKWDCFLLKAPTSVFSYIKELAIKAETFQEKRDENGLKSILQQMLAMDVACTELLTENQLLCLRLSKNDSNEHKYLRHKAKRLRYKARRLKESGDNKEDRGKRITIHDLLRSDVINIPGKGAVRAHHVLSEWFEYIFRHTDFNYEKYLADIFFKSASVLENNAKHSWKQSVEYFLGNIPDAWSEEYKNTFIPILGLNP